MMKSFRTFVAVIVCLFTAGLAHESIAQETLLEQGVAEYKAGNQYAALQTLSRYINANPADYRAYLWRSQLYIKTVSNDSALKDLDRALGLNPRNADGYYLRGVVLMLQGEKEKACSDLIQAASLGQKTAIGEAQKYCR